MDADPADAPLKGPCQVRPPAKPHTHGASTVRAWTLLPAVAATMRFADDLHCWEVVYLYADQQEIETLVTVRCLLN